MSDSSMLPPVAADDEVEDEDDSEDDLRRALCPSAARCGGRAKVAVEWASGTVSRSTVTSRTADAMVVH